MAYRLCIVVALALGLAAPAHAGPPYLTDDPEPPPYGHYELVFFTMGLETDGIAAGALPAMEFNYGGFPNTQLHVMLPLARPVKVRNGIQARRRLRQPGQQRTFGHTQIAQRFAEIKLRSGGAAGRWCRRCWLTCGTTWR